MTQQNALERLRKRTAAVELAPDEFREHRPPAGRSAGGFPGGAAVACRDSGRDARGGPRSHCRRPSAAGIGQRAGVDRKPKPRSC